MEKIAKVTVVLVYGHILQRNLLLLGSRRNRFELACYVAKSQAKSLLDTSSWLVNLFSRAGERLRRNLGFGNYNFVDAKKCFKQSGLRRIGATLAKF
ncbi:hypothetical protein BLOT_004548 [Blomia tropicalis]|nr:hypothetical protein BLOT_004548 [Blomia tropicalis]